MTRIGEGVFSPPTPVIPQQRQADPLTLRLEMVLAALEGLRESLTELPTPQVFVDAPDLSAIVTAVNGLKPGADADQIAEAVVRTLAPTATPAESSDWQDRLIEALGKLDFRLKGVGTSGAGLVSDISDRANRVLGTVTLAGGSSGLTNTELRATPVPVSGTVSVSNFPATQPVSIASTVPVSGTFWQATQPVSLATNTPDVIDRVGRLLGHVTVDNASLAVTGAFFQATQPVSLATNTPDVIDRVGRLLGHVTVDNASLAVTGTFWQATQPVSGTVTDNQGTPNSVANAWPVKNTDGTNTAAVKAASTAAAATDPALVTALSPNSPLPAGTNQIGTTLGPSITKGTQGATGYSTQDLKDAGRSAKTMFSAFVSTALTETAINFQVSTAGGAPAAAAANYTVTAGKTLRIQAIYAAMRAGGATPAASLATFKMKVGGNQQGIAYMVACPTTVAAGPTPFPGLPMPIVDGLELAAGAVLSFTLTLSAWVATNTPIVDLTVIGYEY